MRSIRTAAIVGIAGPTLRADEATLLRDTDPVGVILFARNVVDPAQLAALAAALRDALPPGAVLAVDQEGGRVARLRPPHWAAHPPAARLATPEASAATGGAIGREMRAAGFDVVCAPVLDRAVPGADPVIGDRAFSADPDEIARRAGAFAEALAAAGVVPVGKHVPGHGRATADSHVALPVLDDIDDADLAPFAALADTLPAMMTAHVLYRAVDPDRPATVSPVVIDRVIRGRIGFAGLLVTDDLSMEALPGTPAGRGAAAIAAGCDLALYGAGLLAETAALLAALPPLAERSRARLHRALQAAGRAP